MATNMRFSWDIVLFTEDNSCEYVPSSWAVNEEKTLYLWPKLKSQMKTRKLIDECADPDYLIDYFECSARCKGTAFNINEAKEMVKFVIDNPTTDEESRGRNTHLISSRDGNPNSNVTVCSGAIDNPTTDEESRGCNAYLISSRDGNPNSDVTVCSGATESQCVGNNNTQDAGASMMTNLSVNEPLKDTLKKVLRQMVVALGDIKYEVQDLKKEVKELTTMMLQIKISNNPVDFKQNYNEFDLPLSTEEDIENLNEQLSDENTFKNMMTLLLAVGGEDPKKHILRIFKKILKKDLALKFSGMGRKGKKNFSKLQNVKQVITEVIQYKHKNSTDLEISKIIGTVLATAGDWEGGRKTRLPEDKSNE